MEAIKALLKQISTFWEGKDKRFRRNAIIIASVALLAIIVSSVLLNQVEYATLYTGLDAEDSAAVLTALKEQKVACKVSGGSILVPAAEADSLRMSLSGEVKKGFNLDILKQGQGLGLTESDKQDYRKYQIQQDIKDAIETLEGIDSAKVAITMPRESTLVIADNRQEATAGVIITLDNGVELNASQVKTIALFVQKAVPGLKLDNISIMDSNMRNLDINGSEDMSVSASDRFALQNDVQAKLRRQILALLQPVFGMGRVEAQVNVSLDFNTEVVDSIQFEPVVDSKNGIVVSIDKLREQIVNGTGTNQEPGTAANTGTGTTTYPVVNVDNGTYEKNAEKINYEINSIRKHLEKEKGAIKSLSVSVIVDNTGLKEDYSDTVLGLVTTAVGVSQDYVTVAFLPMAGSQAIQDTFGKSAEVEAEKLKTDQYIPFAILGSIVLVVLVALMLAFGTKRAKHKAEIDQQTAILTAEAAASEELQQMEDELAAIKIVKESGTKEQIGKLIEDNPELVANLLRSWLADEQE